MAISDGTAGAWAAVNATTQTVTLPSHSAGQMLLVRAGMKHATVPGSITCGTSGWTKLGQFYDGGGASSNGGGGVVVAVFYKEAASSSETNPVVTFHASVSATPGCAVAVSYSKGASDAWVTPEGAGGAFTSATSYSATIQSHVSATSGDMLDAFAVGNDNNTMTVPTVTQTGLTLDTVTEYPATALSSATSNDIEADGCNRLATAGTSSAAAVVTGTLNIADSGSAWVTRLRVTTVQNLTRTTADSLASASEAAARAVAAKARTGADALATASEALARSWSTARAAADALTGGGPGAVVRESYSSGSGCGGVASTSHVITKPTGTASGDVLVLAISTNGGSLDVDAYPSGMPEGWVLMASAVGQSNPKFHMIYKVAGGSEPADYTFTTSTAVYDGYICARYSGVDNTTPMDTTPVATDGAAATSYSLTGITTATDNAMLVMGMACNSSSDPQKLTVTGGEPVTEYVEINSSGAIKDTMAADGTKASAGSTGTIDGAISSSLAWAGVLGALRPAAGGGGGISESITTGLGKLRTAADALSTASEAVVRAAAAKARTAGDALGSLAEAASRIGAKARLAADAVASLVEAADRVAGKARTAADALASTSEAAVRAAAAKARTASDAMASLAEAVVGIKSGVTDWVATAGDALASLSEAAGRAAAAKARTAGDQLATLTEAAARVSAKARTAADALASVAEAPVRLKQSFRTAADALSSISEAAGRAAAAKARTAADALDSLAEAVVGIKSGVGNYVRTAADALAALAEATAREWHGARTVQDAVATLAEAPARLQNKVRAVADALGSVTEVPVRLQAKVRAVADALGALSEAPGRLAGYLRTAPNTLGSMAEAASRAAMALVRAPADTLGAITESVVAAVGGAYSRVYGSVAAAAAAGRAVAGGLVGGIAGGIAGRLRPGGTQGEIEEDHPGGTLEG